MARKRALGTARLKRATSGAPRSPKSRPTEADPSLFCGVDAVWRKAALQLFRLHSRRAPSTRAKDEVEQLERVARYYLVTAKKENSTKLKCIK